MKEKTTQQETMRLDSGTLYRKTSGGTWYYRFQINGKRKAVSLKLRDKDKALEAAKKLVLITQSDNAEVIAAHVKVFRKIEKKQAPLSLEKAWELYSKHPERNNPATIHEQFAIRRIYDEFCRFAGMIDFSEVTQALTEDYAVQLKKSGISVSTHNRKLKRLRKIFEVLKEYHDNTNPFEASTLRRKAREEQEDYVGRKAFTREQEQEIRRVLDDPKYHVLNKHEIKVIFYIGMFTGQRLKDCVMLRWEKVNMDRRIIQVKQFKTGKEVSIPIANQLYEVLQNALQWKGDQEQVCPLTAERYKRTDAKGENIGSQLVNVDVLRVVRWIGLATSVGMKGRKKKAVQYGFHSLRHSFASFAAEAGIPKAVILSILGAESKIVDKFYTHVGETAQNEAIAVLDETMRPDARTEKQKKAKLLEILNSTETPEKRIERLQQLLKNR